MIKTAIVTISDACSAGRREDLSGPAARDMLDGELYDICKMSIVPDEFDQIVTELKTLADDEHCTIVLTSGGTGPGPRDITPEATIEVCDRMAPGFAEVARAEGMKKTHKAMLSRAVAGLRGSTLIINLPGSPKAVRESLDAIIETLPHAAKMIAGGGH